MTTNWVGRSQLRSLRWLSWKHCEPSLLLLISAAQSYLTFQHFSILAFMSVGLVRLSLTFSWGLPCYLQISRVQPIDWDDARSNIGAGEARISVSLTSFYWALAEWFQHFSFHKCWPCAPLNLSVIAHVAVSCLWLCSIQDKQSQFAGHCRPTLLVARFRVTWEHLQIWNIWQCKTTSSRDPSQRQ